jgi:hypothetical protein
VRLTAGQASSPSVQGAQSCCSAIWWALAPDPVELGRTGINDDRLLVAVKHVVAMPAHMIVEPATELPWGW